MKMVLYALVAVSGLIETAIGISFLVWGRSHRLLSWLPELGVRLEDSSSSFDFLIYFAALVCLLGAALHVLIWRWLQEEKEEAHRLLILYGLFAVIGGILLFQAFRGAGSGWVFLLIDSLRGALLVAASGIVLLSPSTVSELRLPGGVASRSSRREHRPRRERGPRRHRTGPSKADRAVAETQGATLESAASSGGVGRKAGVRRASGRGEPKPSTGERRGPGEQDQRRPTRATRARGGRQRRRVPAGEAVAQADDLTARRAAPATRAEAVGHGSARSLHGEGPRRTGESSDPERRGARRRPDRSSRRSRPGSNSFQDSTERRDPKRQYAVSITPPSSLAQTGSVETSESEPGAEAGKDQDRSGGSEVFAGRRPKKGRYSTGALFRPRPKRSRRPLWGDAEGTAKREWSWPEDMAAGPKEDSREQPEVAEDD